VGAAGLAYETAGNLHLCPDNAPELVEAVARWLGFALDEWFVLEPAPAAGGAPGGAPAEPPAPLFPTPCSVREALTRYCDLTGRVDRDLVAQLAPFAASAAERARLRRLGGGGPRAEFDAWARAPMRSVAELFQEFSFRGALPLAAFLQLAPRLQPRVYTVASSALAQPGRLAIVASVLDAPKPGPDASRRMRGVATTQLERIARAGEGVGAGAGDAPVFVRALVRPSTFRLPPDARTPVVLVGPGTGVAPMRAFLHERRALRARGAAVGEAVLFFGCRRRGEDFILRAELEAFLADGTLSALHTAFSREGAEGAPRVYVQQLVRAEAPALLALVARGAHVYVCGGTEMGKDVLAAFEAIGVPARELQRASPPRYVQELWSSH